MRAANKYHQGPQRAIKRLLDIVLSMAGLVVFTPFFIAIPLIYWVTSSGPAFFAQERPGLNGKIFTIYKFRTMNDLRDEFGQLLPDVDRLTPLGSLLRKFSLDELPQLWNVLIGELSFVGPRPLLVKYLSLYNSEQARRHEVTPGITGWAQVKGRNSISWEEKFELDLWYIDHWSLLFDFKILALTILKVFQHTDVSAAGHVTMPEFTGTKGGPCA